MNAACSAGFFLVLTLYLYLFCFTDAGVRSLGDYANMTPVFNLLMFTLAWAMILALVGFGARHLRRLSAGARWWPHRQYLIRSGASFISRSRISPRAKRPSTSHREPRT